jgi:hypothetical protein
MANQLAAPLVTAAVLALLRADVTMRALVSKSPTDNGAAVYEGVAPSGAPYDYLVIEPAPLETPANAMGRCWGAAVLVYLRAVSRKSATAQRIISRAIALLDYPTAPLVVAGYSSAMSELVTAGPGYPEEVRGEIIRHYPAVIRVTVKT